MDWVEEENEVWYMGGWVGGWVGGTYRSLSQRR